MTGPQNRHRLFLLLGALFLTACVVTAEPEWVATYLHQPDTGNDQITWLHDMERDSFGNVFAVGSGINVDTSDGLNRTQDALLVRFTPSGSVQLLSALDLADGQHRSDDSARLIALDPQDNLYTVVHQYEVIDDQGQTASWLASHNAQGDLRWKKRISEADDVRGLAWHQGRIYTTGSNTLAHDAQGNEQLRIEHPETPRRAIAFADNGDLVVAGTGTVSRYSGEGKQRWQYESKLDLINNGSVLVAQSGDVVVAQGMRDERGGALVARIDSQGNELWSRTFDAARSSYGAAGPTLVLEDFRGDLYLVASNDAGRRIVKLDASGTPYWNKTNRSGIVQDADLIDGGLFVVGNARDEKRDARDGAVVAEASLDRTVQNTQGSLVVDGDRIYTGYAALDDDNRFAMHVSRYQDQPID